jgi:predicted metalloprotease with PDZ domain
VPTGFGVTWKPDDPLLIIEHVIMGGTAAAAGVLPGDELLAINGLRVLPQSVDSRLQRLLLDEQVQLTLARNGRLLTLPVRVQHALPEKYAITLKAKISKREKSNMEAWLGSKLRFSR